MFKKEIEKMVDEIGTLGSGFVTLALLCHFEEDKEEISTNAYAFMRSLFENDKASADAFIAGVADAIIKHLGEENEDGEND